MAELHLGYDRVHTSSVAGRNETTTSHNVKNLKDLSWYVGELVREKAENLLIKDCIPGTYLLRKSPRHEEYAVSVRTFDFVNHFIVKYNPFDMNYTFGPEQFSSLSTFISFFESCPVVKYSNGEKELILSFPFTKQAENNKRDELSSPYEIGVGESKEGYLFKRGNIHKNWKDRWFIVEKDVIKYFHRRLDAKPLKEFNLSEVTELRECEIDEKRNCFCLVFPHRTLYLVAKCTEERNSWMEFLQGRVVGVFFIYSFRGFSFASISNISVRASH